MVDNFKIETSTPPRSDSPFLEPSHVINSVVQVVQNGINFFKKKEEQPTTAKVNILVNTDQFIQGATLRLEERKQEERANKAQIENGSVEFENWLKERQKPLAPGGLGAWVDGVLALPAPELDGYFSRTVSASLLFGRSYMTQFLSAISPSAGKVIDSLKALLQTSQSFLELGSETDSRLTQKLRDPLPQTKIKQQDMSDAITYLNSHFEKMATFKAEIEKNLNKISPLLKFFLNFILKRIIKTAQDPLIEGLIKAKKDVVNSVVNEANSAFSRLQEKRGLLEQQQAALKPTPLVATSSEAPLVVVPSSPVTVPITKASAVREPSTDITSLSIELVEQYTPLIAPMKRLKCPRLPDKIKDLKQLVTILVVKEEIEVTAATIMAKTHSFTNEEQTQIVQFLLGSVFNEAPDYVQETVEKLKTLEPGQQTLQVFMGLLLNQLHTDFETIKIKVAEKIGPSFSEELKEAIQTEQILTKKYVAGKF